MFLTDGLFVGYNVSVGWVIRGLLVRLTDCLWVKHGLCSAVPKMWAMSVFRNG